MGSNKGNSLDFPPFSPPGLGGEAGGVIKVTQGAPSAIPPPGTGGEAIYQK
jgi:hypothetical protein